MGDSGAAGPLSDGVVTLRAADADGRFAVEHDGQVVGDVAVRRIGDAEGELSWSLVEDQRGKGYATRAVRLLVEHALERTSGLEPGAGPGRPRQRRAVRVATRSGLRREGVRRVEPGRRPDERRRTSCWRGWRATRR